MTYSTHVYEITVQQQLDAQWSDWFLPLVMDASTNRGTTLRGTVRDQAELHGILGKIRDLNLTLLSVQRIASTPEAGANYTSACKT